MRGVEYQYFEEPTVNSKQFNESEILMIIQSGLIFSYYVRVINRITGFTSSFEFVELEWDKISKRVRGISGFSVYDSTEGKFIAGSCSTSSFKKNNQSLLLFSDNRHGSKYQKQLLEQRLIHPPTQKREVYRRQRILPSFKKFKK